MTNEPAVPPTPDGEQRETVTAPAGAALPVPMRVPKHGRGRLLTRGQIGNKGGGRHPQKVLDQLIEICGLAADEMLLRLNNAEVRAKLTVDELRLILKEAGAFVLPKQVQLSGPAGGPIPIESVYEQHRRSLRERLDRLRGLHPPTSEPAPTAPERAHNPVVTVPL